MLNFLSDLHESFVKALQITFLFFNNLKYLLQQKLLKFCRSLKLSIISKFLLFFLSLFCINNFIPSPCCFNFSLKSLKLFSNLEQLKSSFSFLISLQVRSVSPKKQSFFLEQIANQ